MVVTSDIYSVQMVLTARFLNILITVNIMAELGFE